MVDVVIVCRVRVYLTYMYIYGLLVYSRKVATHTCGSAAQKCRQGYDRGPFVTCDGF